MNKECPVCNKDFMVDRLPYPTLCTRCKLRYAERWWNALREIAECPDSDSVENCHDLMYDIACASLVHVRE